MREYITCDFCHMEFVKGKGHMCWCEECSKKHPMCNPCYKEALHEGMIRKTPNKMIYNSKTLEKHK